MVLSSSVPGINRANLIANGHAIGTASGGRWAGTRQLWIGLGSAFEVISVDAVEVSLTLPFLPWSGAEVEQKQAHVAPGFGRCKQAQRLAECAQRRADVQGLQLC